MAEPVQSDSSPDTDREFDPSADMLVHDFDDERTMDEEEAFSNSNSESCGGGELDALQKEGDMPIEELLSMYYSSSGGLPPRPVDEGQQESRSSSEEEILSNQDLTLDKEEIARDLQLKSEDTEKDSTVNDILENFEMPSQTVRLLRSANSQSDSSDEDSEDADYEPVEPPPQDDWKKTIQVGSDYQAPVPTGLSKYGDAPAYENEDRLLWCPYTLEDKEVEHFLSEVQTQNQQSAQGVDKLPEGAHIHDDEQALYLLLQCGHNVEEALRRRKMQAVPPTDPMSLWSEEECRNFENGLRHYGKDFYVIQQNKVKTRSVGELVQFYYLWKKTERHDVFANKTRLEKKKYNLHPGVTDYMDRFLDEQDNPVPPRDRASSPGINSLLYGDPKRHTPELRANPEELAAALEMVQKVVGTNPLAFSPIKLSAPLDINNVHTTVASEFPAQKSLQNSSENENVVFSTASAFVGIAPAPTLSFGGVSTGIAGTTPMLCPSTVVGSSSLGTIEHLTPVISSSTSLVIQACAAESGEPAAKRMKTDTEGNVSPQMCGDHVGLIIGNDNHSANSSLSSSSTLVASPSSAVPILEPCAASAPSSQREMSAEVKFNHTNIPSPTNTLVESTMNSLSVETGGAVPLKVDSARVSVCYMSKEVLSAVAAETDAPMDTSSSKYTQDCTSTSSSIRSSVSVAISNVKASSLAGSPAEMSTAPPLLSSSEMSVSPTISVGLPSATMAEPVAQ